MGIDKSYKDYVFDSRHMQEYAEYQAKYSVTLRESDRVLIEIIKSICISKGVADSHISLLDMGCSTGNLLLHLKRLLPELSLSGADLAPDIISMCKSDTALEGIEFYEVNMLEMQKKHISERSFDIVVANAALMFFAPDEFVVAIKNLTSILKLGGELVLFDYFTPFEQELEILEKTRAHPEGLKFYFRSHRSVIEATKAAGLREPEFVPFHIPIDLPQSDDAADLTTHTIEGKDGIRLSLRGNLKQPWCHVRTSRAV